MFFLLPTQYFVQNYSQKKVCYFLALLLLKPLHISSVCPEQLASEKCYGPGFYIGSDENIWRLCVPASSSLCKITFFSSVIVVRIFISAFRFLYVWFRALLDALVIFMLQENFQYRGILLFLQRRNRTLIHDWPMFSSYALLVHLLMPSAKKIARTDPDLVRDEDVSLGFQKMLTKQFC